MKKTNLIFLFASLFFIACNGNQQPNKQETNNNIEINSNTTELQDETNTKKQNNMTTIHLTKAEFLTKVVNYETNTTEWKYLGDKPAIVDFYASWCGPCKMIAPILEELAAEYGDKIYIYKIDTEAERELAGAFNIRSIPTLLFVPMNGNPQMVQGAMSKEGFKQAIDSILLKQ